MISGSILGNLNENASDQWVFNAAFISNLRRVTYLLLLSSEELLLPTFPKTFALQTIVPPRAYSFPRNSSLLYVSLPKPHAGETCRKEGYRSQGTILSFWFRWEM